MTKSTLSNDYRTTTQKRLCKSIVIWFGNERFWAEVQLLVEMFCLAIIKMQQQVRETCRNHILDTSSTTRINQSTHTHPGQ